MFLLKTLWDTLFSEPKSPFTIIGTEVPYHIKEVGKLYPILHTVATNKALGEIRKFVFHEKENILRVGQAFIINNDKGTDSTWIHLGNDFFKLVMKA